MNIQSLPLLTIITFFPLIGIFIIFFISKKKENLIKVIANIVTALTFLISLTLLLGFDPQAEGMQFVEKI